MGGTDCSVPKVGGTDCFRKVGGTDCSADCSGVGYVDRQNDRGFVPLGTSAAWGWQQGCMLQFLGRTGRRIIHNDRQDDAFVARVIDLDRPEQPPQTLPMPIYTTSADGTFAMTTDFRRIDNLRPGYGYDGLSDPFNDDPAPAQSGVWRMDLTTGEAQLVLSLADVAALPWPGPQPPGTAWHYFNHLLINPAGTRFIVLHRYRRQYDPASRKFEGGFVTRMLTANIDGSDVHVLDPSGHTSHFIWKDDRVVTMWTRPIGKPWGFYDFIDGTDPVTAVGPTAMPLNGHNTFLAAPYDDVILNDTYPDATRRQTVYLYHVPSGRRIDLGHFPSPPSYTGEVRCDTHPRSSRDGRTVCIDSPHAGGRQLHLLDIGEVLDSL